MIPLRDDVPSRRVPLVNYAVIALNAAVFLKEVFLGPRLKAFLYQYGVVGVLWSDPILAADVTLAEKAVPLLTSMFLHGGFLHVISNLWILYIFGDNVEDRMGHFKYLIFYLASGVASGLVQLATHWSSPIPTIGASGAIAGVMGAYLVFFPRARIVTLVPIFVFVRVVEVPAVFFLGLWFVSQLYNGVMDLNSAFSGIAWWAHIGGFAAGFAAAARIQAGRRRTRYVFED